MPGALPQITQERIDYLEGEIERLDEDVRRLEEESRFMQQLLSERPEKRALPESDDSD